VLSLICANAARLPIWLQALDGNRADSASFSGTVSAYLDQLGDDESTPLRVADAALYNQATLQAMPQDTRWLSRAPGTLGAVKLLYTEVADDNLLVADEHTRYAEFGNYYAGIPQRWLLVLHEPTRQRQAASLQKGIDQERQQAEKALQRLMNKDYGCEDAVCKAVNGLKARWRYLEVRLDIGSQTRYEQPGRPTADTPSHPVWRFEAQLVEDDTCLEQLRRTHGKYVIATNELDAHELSLPERLAIYKQQSTSVERGFRFLKDPLFFAHSLFLKKPLRSMALLMVMGLSLLVYALAEHHLRQQLAQRDETLPDQTGKPTQRPTARRVFQMLEGVDVLYIEQAGVRRRLILNLTELRRQILPLFSPHVQKIYLDC
jgi:transposase